MQNMQTSGLLTEKEEYKKVLYMFCTENPVTTRDESVSAPLATICIFRVGIATYQISKLSVKTFKEIRVLR